MTRSIPSVIIILIISAFLSGCSRSYPSSQWNVLWISIDDLKADHLGCYGYQRHITPGIDSLARESVIFDRCISQAPWTLPSYASMLTSRYPYELVMSDNYLKHILRDATPSATQDTNLMPTLNNHWYTTLRPDVPTLAELLKAQGFVTAAWTNNQWLSESLSGLNRGFDEYVSMEKADAFYVPADQTMARVKEWIDKNKDRRWLVFVHLMDLHRPYKEHPEFNLGQRGIDRYDANLAFIDQALGPFLDWLKTEKLRPKTMIVFNADHGEGVYEDDAAFIGHGGAVIMDVIRVPLLITIPRGPSAARVERQVRSLDVLPTVLDYLGIAFPEGLRGASLRGFMDGKPQPDFPDYSLTMAVMKGPEQIALTTEKFQIIYRPAMGEAKAYQVWGSAWKEVGQSQETVKLFNMLKTEMMAMKKDLESRNLQNPLNIDEHTKKILESLGYH